VVLAFPDPLPFVLVVARLAGLVVASPVFGHGLVPVRVRAGLVGVLALALAPVVPLPALPAEPSALALAGLAAAETAIGMLLGLVAQLVLAGVQLGGEVAGLQLGVGLAHVIDPSTPAGASVVAQWQHLAALVVFLVLDVHHVLLRAVLESFRVAPIGQALPSTAVLADAVAQGARLFAVGVHIAAPVVVVLLLVNGALAVLARTLPQLNVFAVGFPVHVGVGLVVVGASLPFGMRFLAGELDAMRGILEALVGALAHG
jgi:flagellar biosynthetic protein FliR